MSVYLLIAIHPEHAANILSGKKKFEYRKVLPKRKVSHLVLYCTAPRKRIVAVVEVKGCLNSSPSSIWKMSAGGAGISHAYFDSYFLGKHNAVAFSLGKVFELTRPMKLDEFPRSKKAPQSFSYLDEPDVKLILDKVSF